ncbi:hypothetical protein BV898_08741 [Hypsibius exemplaris]|uniref:Uncharacterized protein n=1 Tax=Hypsibius exemplaris TaxID=2072580 RepID=A0A1W0WPM7_HYPEX|nr:hypothetical protein BV898_08741 [Hypsibius exemplaris]
MALRGIILGATAAAVRHAANLARKNLPDVQREFLQRCDFSSATSPFPARNFVTAQIHPTGIRPCPFRETERNRRRQGK